MDVKLLIDDIVRQTTVLIAQLSTAAGARAPLAHVANQVFVALAKELESQGVGKKVVADMFGLALRSYQLKMQRLTEQPKGQRSLWQKVYRQLRGGTRVRHELYAALAPADTDDVAAVLHDLVESGLAFASGRGAATVFGLTSDTDRARLLDADRELSIVNLIWQMVATGRVESRADLDALGLDRERVEPAVAVLLSDGRVTEHDGELSAETFFIPVGAVQGWEAAVSDHFRALATAVAAKLSPDPTRNDEQVGGATLRFTVHPDHPFEQEVYGLLARWREEMGTLWRQVAEHNKLHPPPENSPMVTFYFGQCVTAQPLNGETR
jgi:hypothetical protein